jgi:hypothetical protein
MFKILTIVAVLGVVNLCGGAQAIIDNDEVTVWDLTGTEGQAIEPITHNHDFVTVYLAPGADGLHAQGDAVFAHSGVSAVKPHERIVVIELKDYKLITRTNTSGYPLAFPRVHAEKLIDNDRVTVWSYRWNPGEPTPMHFHDKDTVVVYMEDTALQSTTQDGKSTSNAYSKFETRFMLRNRIHSELLLKGTGSGVMTELK